MCPASSGRASPGHAERFGRHPSCAAWCVTLCAALTFGDAGAQEVAEPASEQAPAPPAGAAAPDAVDDGNAVDTGNAADAGVPFDRRWLIGEARRRSLEPFAARELELEGDYATLDRDAYRDIRFRPEHRPWATDSLPFEIDLLAPGFLYERPVAIHTVENGVARELAWDAGFYDYGALASPPDDGARLAYTGLSVRAPLNRPDVMDEVATFQGASYFRAVARDLSYGLAARGLALGTATSEGEEFPFFDAFWIERPADGAATLVVHALLDSPSLVGAYRFEITPGTETRTDVRSTLFPRTTIEAAGIAPLTSMFLFDGKNRTRFDDYREAVHDSDALQIVNGAGERILRSLGNPTSLQVSSFVDRDPVGFGLVQRHRRFEDFADDETRFERMPSAWVEPVGDWGAGSVELVEIPSNREIHDNIVTYWKPAEPLRSGERYDYDYRLEWTTTPADAVPLLRVADVRLGGAGKGRVKIVLDLETNDPTRLRDVDAGLVADIAVARGETRDVTIRYLPGLELHRVSFEFDPGEANASDLRVRLVRDGRPASESWIYRWTR